MPPKLLSRIFQVLGDTEPLLFSPAPEALRRDTRGVWQGLSQGVTAADTAWVRPQHPQEGMTTHSNILAWRIPWTEEPGGLQSLGLQSLTQLK